MSSSATGRIRRLAEELEELGVLEPSPLLLEELDRALRPRVHERRVPSGGAVIDPSTDPAAWGPGTDLDITRTPIGSHPLDAARRFVDGLTSWLIRRTEGPTEWLLFDRSAGSERDLGVIANVLGATLVQRHPNGTVRVVGPFGVLRWRGIAWHHEAPVDAWSEHVQAQVEPADAVLVHAMLEFAVHDLGANGIGALLIYRTGEDEGPWVEERLPVPPPLRIDNPRQLAPLRHALTQVDGAALFDCHGVLRRLGVHLLPSARAEESVDAFKGTRHTAGVRYSYDDPDAIVVAVSEDGPVSVLRGGEILGRSPIDPA